MIRSSILTVLALLAAASVAVAQEQLKPFIPWKADAPPVIDGILNDPIWQKATQETGFKTYSPDYGRDMTERTVVYYAYDRENLYFAFKCYDRQPDKIKAAVSARDSIRPDDWVCINLDSFNDQQALYAFYVNPLGIQMDSRYAARNEDYGVDLVWYSAGRIDQDGYTIEVKIPFKSIRFSRRNPVEMSVIFERRITRYSESGTYPPLDPKKGQNWLIQTRPLLYYDVKHYTLFELLPAVTYGNRSSIADGSLVSEGNKGDFSLTTKYGLSSHMILDGTYNPDFSQVESDAGQVDFNQRFALFYPEKRPFFLEGREIFNFSGNSSGDPLGAIVHTRNIVDPLVAGKLSGKIGDRNTLASIYAMDDLPDAGDQKDYAHFAIMRYKRSMSRDGYLGGILTDREGKDGSNRVGGADGLLRLTEASAMGFHALMSQDLMAPGASSDLGRALGLDYTRSNRQSTVNLAVQDISDNFRTETGYVTRTGVTRLSANAAPAFYPESKLIRRIDPMIHTTQTRDNLSGKYETSDAFDVRFLLPRSSSIQAGYVYSTEIFLGQKFRTSGLKFSGSSQFRKQLYFSVRYLRPSKIRYIDNPFQGRGNDASGSMTYQPSENLNLNLSLTYSDFYRSSDAKKVYDYAIIRLRNIYQMNKYLFFRGIVEYNSFRRRVLTDFLASFTYIPGTVIHFGYGSLLEKRNPADWQHRQDYSFHETARSFFFKASYLWRL